MKDELRLCPVEEALGVVEARQVVVAAARSDDVVAIALQPLDQVRAQEPRAAGHHYPGHACSTFSWLSQSTRPIQRSRLAAYQRIVRSTPSSHEIFGSQPVSRFSLS
jgi:hypothetical protein